MATHQLKTWPKYYDMVYEGKKRFEIRKNDRYFEVGDTLVLKRFDNELSLYTGEISYYAVDYILTGEQFGVMDGFVCMSIRPIN